MTRPRQCTAQALWFSNEGKRERGQADSRKTPKDSKRYRTGPHIRQWTTEKFKLTWCGRPSCWSEFTVQMFPLLSHRSFWIGSRPAGLNHLNQSQRSSAWIGQSEESKFGRTLKKAAARHSKSSFLPDFKLNISYNFLNCEIESNWQSERLGHKCYTLRYNSQLTERLIDVGLDVFK